MSSNEEITGKGVYSPEVLELVRSANEYCSFLEECEKLESVGFIRKAVQILSGIYHHTVRVDETEPMLEGGNEKFVTEQDWSAVYQKILHLLGSHNSYLRIAQNDEFDRSDLVTHTISEDLADIYQDLKDFTLQYRQGIEEIMNDALWELMDNFDNFWSEKLTNALGALNKLYITRTDPQASDDVQAETNDPDSEPPTYDNSFFTRLQDLNEEDI